MFNSVTQTFALDRAIARAPQLAQLNSDDYRRENVISFGKSLRARATGGKLIQQPSAFIQFPSLISALASCKRLR